MWQQTSSNSVGMLCDVVVAYTFVLTFLTNDGLDPPLSITLGYCCQTIWSGQYNSQPMYDNTTLQSYQSIHPCVNLLQGTSAQWTITVWCIMQQASRLLRPSIYGEHFSRASQACFVLALFRRIWTRNIVVMSIVATTLCRAMRWIGAHLFYARDCHVDV